MLLFPQTHSALDINTTYRQAQAAPRLGTAAKRETRVTANSQDTASTARKTQPQPQRQQYQQEQKPGKVRAEASSHELPAHPSVEMPG